MRFHTYDTFLESLHKPKFYVSFMLGDSTVPELKEYKMPGVSGIANTPMNVAEWLPRKDVMLMMPYEDTVAINNLEQIRYDDAEQLVANNMAILRRLIYVSNDEDNSVKFVLEQVSKKVRDILKSNKNPEIMKLSDIWLFGSVFYNVFDDTHITNLDALKEYFADSVKRLAEVRKVELDIPRGILDKIIENAIALTALTYEDEQEWIVKDHTLNIPKSAILFVVEGFASTHVTKKGIMKAREYVETNELHKYYRVQYVQDKDVYRYMNSKMTPKYKKHRYEDNREDLLKVA